MKDSLKKYIAYCSSDKELAYHLRINGEWYEESFLEFEKLVKEVLDDYSQDIFYPKLFIFNFLYSIETILGIIDNVEYKFAWPDDYFEERIQKLKKLRLDFIMEAGK